MVIAPEKFARGMTRQLDRLREARASGMPRRGWKIGINVPEVLDRLGLPHSTVGWLDGRRVFSSGATVPTRPGARLHVEPELAILLAEGVPPACEPADAERCIAAVHPALELVDYAKPAEGLEDVVAHCMFHDATVIGRAAPPEAARCLGTRWPLLRVGDRRGDPPRADLVPSSPGELVSFVAAYLAAFGQSLAPDDLVLSGAYLAKALALGAGVEAVADFGQLGSVSVRIEVR